MTIAIRCDSFNKHPIISVTLILSIVPLLFFTSVSLLQSSNKANADTKVDDIGVRNNPFGIAFNEDSNSMYVTHDNSDGSVSIIDGRSVVWNIENVEDNLRGIAYNKDNKYMYVANFGDDTVDPITGTQLACSDHLSTDDNPFGVAYNPDVKKMYVTNTGDNDVSVIEGCTVDDDAEIDLHIGSPIGPAAAATGLAEPKGIAYNEFNKYMYVAMNNGLFIQVFNPLNNNFIVATLRVGDGPYDIEQIRCDPRFCVSGILMYVTLEREDRVAVIDGTTLRYTIPVGDSPHGIEFNPVNGKVYVANHGSSSVTVINPNDPFALDKEQIQVGSRPEDIAINPDDGNSVYVTNSGSGTVSVIAPTSITSRPLTRPLEAVIPVGQEPLGIAFNPTSNTMYVTNHASHSVSVIRDTTVTATIPARGTVDLFGPYGIAYNAEFQRMYVANQQGDSTVSTLDGTTVEDNIKVGAAPTGVAFESANGLVYVTNLQDGTISVISGNNVTDTIEVGGNPFGVAINTVNTKVYVTSGVDNNFVSVIERGANITKTIEVEATPLGIAFNPSNNKMYVANYGNDSISIIDINADTVTNTITGVKTPVSIAYNPLDRSMYVTNLDLDSVTVIEDTIVKTTIPNVGARPYAIAFNSANEKMYVTNEKENTVTVIGKL